MKQIGVGKVATVMGRLYAMDRDFAWERHRDGVQTPWSAPRAVRASDPVQAIKDSYNVVDETGKHLTDEFVLPTVIDESGVVRANDSVVFFNFPPRPRPRDHARVRRSGVQGLRAQARLLPADLRLHDAVRRDDAERVDRLPAGVAVDGRWASTSPSAARTQLRIAETQKYAHVTFFFNGGEERQFPRRGTASSSPSPPAEEVPTFDLKPEMSAYEVTDAVLPCIDEDKYDVIILNFANCDMVGHTGVMAAAMKAVKTVDECAGKIVDAILAKGGKCIITADHGNADQMIRPPCTAARSRRTRPTPCR